MFHFVKLQLFTSSNSATGGDNKQQQKRNSGVFDNIPRLFMAEEF